MTRLIVLASGLSLIAGCGFSIPNGVFSCVGAPDCPTGYFCWNSDGRCYDSKEPEVICQPDTCEEVIAQFAAVEVAVECGMLPDGCGGFVECPPCDGEDTCGANGQNFVCGCEPATCSSVGAQCGDIVVGCGLEGTVNCGECPGELVCGEDNRCVCPRGQSCDAPCGGCEVGEVCVDGQCCTPDFPCADNECGAFDNGCGAMVDCGGCTGTETCEPVGSVYSCVDNCTCEAQGIECGTRELCGVSQLCGVCDASAPLCSDGRCVCVDPYESNDSPTQAAQLECDGSCGLGTVHAEVEGTLDASGDIDFYTLKVPQRPDRAVRVDLSGLQSTREILLTYICPDGSERVKDCSGSGSSLGGDKYCIEDGTDTLRLTQECSGSGLDATVIIGIGAKEGEFKGPCDDYSFTVSSYSFEYDD
jgi:hypothetical protein